jgi:hypothetical protein
VNNADGAEWFHILSKRCGRPVWGRGRSPFDLRWSKWDDAGSHVEELIALTGDYRLRGPHMRKQSSAGDRDTAAEDPGLSGQPPHLN